jgi:predicted nuclease of predicted toxin-antitoxin system
MRFLVDECTGPAVAEWLRKQKHEVFSVYEEARGMNDDFILQKAFIENWILITNDKDFGEKVYRERRPHHGVILLRLEDERAVIKIETIQRLLRIYSDRIIDQFIVVTGTKVRFARQFTPHRFL